MPRGQPLRGGISGADDDGMTRVIPTTRSADKGGPTLAAAVESFKADKVSPAPSFAADL